MNCVFELDDFQTDEISLYALAEFKRRNSAFKATCFTIYGKCDLNILRDVASLDWIEIAAHGLDHQTEHLWGYADMDAYLRSIEATGLFTKLFKMPWFGSPSDSALKALSERHYRYATRRRMQSRDLDRHSIRAYFGCPWTVYAHPPTLSKKLRDVEIERYSKFFTVSEMFDNDIAVKNGWVR